MTPPRRFSRALITGIGGSGGSYLAEHLAEHQPGIEIHGLARWHSTAGGDSLARVGRPVTVHEADLNDFGSVANVLRAVQPDVVFHLAAHANVRASFQTPQAVLANNILGTSNLLEAIRLIGIEPLVQICSTSEVYGQVGPADVPIREDAPLRPASPYAVSKVAQDLLGDVYFRAYGMPVIRTRMFTYINPRRRDLFATAFARQVARIEAGLQSELVHGNLDSVRTIVDVRDAVRAYWLAVERCALGETYNIGGQTTMTVGEVLERLISLSRVPVKTRVDQRLIRPADVTLQVPCVDKFVAATGWRPEHSVEDSLVLLLDHWRTEVERERAARR